MRIVRGNPTEEEVAALVVALRGRRPAERKAEPVSGWARREDLLRRPLHPGPDAWRRATTS